VPSHPTLIRYVVLAWLLALAALLPILKPALPGNTAFVDYVNLAFFAPLALYLLWRRRIEVRYLVPMLLVAFASLTSTINSQVVGVNLATLAQEIYLFSVTVMVFNMLETEREVRFLTRCWFLAACVIGALALTELAADPNVRARATFDNPNLTSSYLGMSAFLVLVPGVIRWTLVRLGLWCLILGGALATKSMSALLSLGVGATVLFVVAWSRATSRQRTRMAVAAGCVALVGMLALPQMLAMKNYANRMDDSAEGRELIWETGIETFLHNPLGIGIGPAGFQHYIVILGGPFKGTARKELHSDYLSFLVERGVLGFLALLMLLGTAALLAWKGLALARDPTRFLTMLGLAGMLVFTAMDGTTHEMLHYRHVWVLLGLIAAQERLVRRAALGRTVEAGAPAGHPAMAS
jgi:O-antigen ligase